MSEQRSMEHLRLPPHSVDAEQAVLGGLLLVPEVWGAVAHRLREQDFYRKDHQMIYRGIGELQHKDHAPDAVTLGDWFEAQGIAELVGGSRYILELANTTPSAANIQAYVDLVLEKSILRQLIDVGTDLVNTAFKPEGRPGRDLAATAMQTLSRLGDGGRGHGFRTFKSIAGQWVRDLQQRYDDGSYAGIPTPWVEFNDTLNGFEGGLLYIIASRPNMGKTPVAMNIAACAAGRFYIQQPTGGKRVAIFSLEMTIEQLFSITIAIHGEGITRSWIKRPSDPNIPDQSHLLAGALAKATEHEYILVDDTAGLSMDEVVLRAKREHMRQPLGMIIIDHAHIMKLLVDRGMSTTDAMGLISKGAKKLAKDLDVPVILLAQLSRACELRADHRPIMSDLRSSGDLEQDADAVIFLYRDDYYANMHNRESQYPGLIEFIFGKLREGTSGKVVFEKFIGARALIENIEEQPTRRAAVVQESVGRQPRSRS